MQQEHIQKEFVWHFGEMGSRWGINRTVGQIYALLFLSHNPLCADDMCDALGFSRSSVSMGLKELQSWNLVRRREIEGDRREHFEAPEDLWKIVRTLIAERKKREIDPTLSKLRELSLEADGNDTHANRRISELRDLIESLTQFYDKMERIETERLVGLIKAGSKFSKLISATDKIIPLSRTRRNRKEN